MAGRPSKLTHAVVDSIGQHLADGATLGDAARLAGVSPRSVHRWKQSASNAIDPTPLQSALLTSISEGDDARIDRYQSRIVAAALEQSIETRVVENGDGTTTTTTITRPANWRAAAWLCARLRPAQFSERFQLQHGGEIAGPPLAAVVIEPVKHSAAIEGLAGEAARR